MDTVLKTENLVREFGRLVAVDGIDLTIRSDEITSIIGPNGAGKTTFYNLLSGMLEPTSGHILLRSRDAENGELTDVTSMEPYEISRLGLSRAFQINNVFEGLTIQENVRVAHISRDKRTLDVRSVAARDPGLNDATQEILELTNLADDAEKVCANLSHGDVRKVEIALALGTAPSVVLLDEPTAGMNISETDRMVDLIEELDDNTDTTFVVTEHDMEVVMDISDRIIVLDGGAVIADGSPDEVMADDRVREAYLGGEGQ